MITDIPHTADPLVLSDGVATFEMRGWMEQVEQSLQSGTAYVSTVNSSNADISTGQSFSGQWELNTLPQVMVSCLVTGSGTLDLYFSNDGGATETKYPVSGFSVDSGVHEFHIAVKGPRSFRVELTPAAGTSLSGVYLYVYYGDFGVATAPLNQAVGLDSDATVTRPTIAQDEITRSLRAGAYQVNKFGYRDDVDVADGDALIIADNTTGAPAILLTASTLTVAYNNATDGSGSSGALAILFSYLDADQIEQQATHVLGGTGSDTTSFSCLGVNRAVLVSTGSGARNANDITITATTGGSVQAFIPAESSVTQQLIYHCETNSTPMIKHVFMSAVKLSGGTAPRVTFKIFVYSRITNTTYEVFRYLMDTSVENSLQINDPCNFPLSAGDVAFITANTDTNNTSVSGRLSLNVYRNV